MMISAISIKFIIHSILVFEMMISDYIDSCYFLKELAAGDWRPLATLLVAVAGSLALAAGSSLAIASIRK